jgi:hypothetical protein
VQDEVEKKNRYYVMTRGMSATTKLDIRERERERERENYFLLFSILASRLQSSRFRQAML